MGLFSSKPNVEKMERKRNVEGLVKVLVNSNNIWDLGGAAKALGNIGDKRAVEPLIQALKCKDSYILENAAEALGKIGDKKAVEPLIQALKDKESPAVKLHAMVALGEIGDARAVDPIIQVHINVYDTRQARVKALVKIGEPAVQSLIQALKDGHGGVYVAEALEKIGEPAVVPLIQALKCKDSHVQENAAETLGKIGDKRAVEPLIQALKDEDSDVRLKVAQVLESIGWQPDDEINRAWYFMAREEWYSLIKLGKPSINPLILALKHKDFQVRENAAKGLKQAGWEPEDEINRAWYFIAKREWDKLPKLGKPAVYPLIQTLGSKIPWNIEKDVRQKAVEALVKIGEPAVDLLIQALKHKDFQVRENAAESLGKIRDARAVDPLIQALSVGEFAIKALGEIGDARAVEPLIWGLHSSSPCTIEALGNIGGPAVELLIQAMKGDNRYGHYLDDMKKNATRALEKIRDARAVEPLIQALIKDGDKNYLVKDKIAGVLVNIGKPAVEPLIQALKGEKDWHLKYYHYNVLYSVLEVLDKIRDLRAAEPIIDYLIANPTYERTLELHRCKNLFGGYLDIIYKVHRGIKLMFDKANSYCLQESNEAVGKLCNISTQISNNILHKISDRKDVEITYECGSEYIMGNIDIWKFSVSFDPQRKMAKDELKRRRNPPYNPSVYLNKEAWKL